MWPRKKNECVFLELNVAQPEKRFRQLCPCSGFKYWKESAWIEKFQLQLFLVLKWRGCKKFQSDDARFSFSGEDGHMADELYKKVRVLCWVMTGPNNLETKARHVKNTWTRHCNIVVFMSSVEDPDFPTVGLGTKEGRDQLYWKTIRAFHYAYEHHIDEADWFLKADDDTYVIVDNLRWVLANHTPDEPIYFGRRFKPYTKQGYMSGGAGYILSKEALRRFVEGFKTQVCSHTTSVEDLAMGQCMEKVGVLAGDSRDGLQRETFHPFVPEQHLTAKFPKSFWYWSYCYYPISEVNGKKKNVYLKCFTLWF